MSIESQQWASIVEETSREQIGFLISTTRPEHVPDCYRFFGASCNSPFGE